MKLDKLVKNHSENCNYILIISAKTNKDVLYNMLTLSIHAPYTNSNNIHMISY